MLCSWIYGLQLRCIHAAFRAVRVVQLTSERSKHTRHHTNVEAIYYTDAINVRRQIFRKVKTCFMAKIITKITANVE